MELTDGMLFVGVAAIFLLALNPWAWSSTKVRDYAVVNCRCFWCAGPKGK